MADKKKNDTIDPNKDPKAWQDWLDNRNRELLNKASFSSEENRKKAWDRYGGGYDKYAPGATGGYDPAKVSASGSQNDPRRGRGYDPAKVSASGSQNDPRRGRGYGQPPAATSQPPSIGQDDWRRRDPRIGRGYGQPPAVPPIATSTEAGRGQAVTPDVLRPLNRNPNTALAGIENPQYARTAGSGRDVVNWYKNDYSPAAMDMMEYLASAMAELIRNKENPNVPPKVPNEPIRGY